jgi:hypothetical protein
MLPELDITELHFAPCQSDGSSPFQFFIHYSEHEILPLFPDVVFVITGGGGWDKKLRFRNKHKHSLWGLICMFERLGFLYL